MISYNVGRIYWELEFAIRYDFVERNHAQRALLELGWPLFQSRQLEELLFPLVRDLAWTLCIDDREADAVALLRKIWNSKQLFSPYNSPKLRELQLRPPTLIPVGVLLAELTNGQDQQILRDLELLQRSEQQNHKQHAHTVEIQGKKIILHPGTEYTVQIPSKKIISRQGMQSTGASPSDNVALIKVCNPPRLPYSSVSSYGRGAHPFLGSQLRQRYSVMGGLGTELKDSIAAHRRDKGRGSRNCRRLLT